MRYQEHAHECSTAVPFIDFYLVYDLQIIFIAGSIIPVEHPRCSRYLTKNGQKN